MTFTPGIPAANNNPSNDQPLMLGNFTSINNWTGVDHNNLQTSSPLFGIHQQTSFNNFSSGSLPSVASAASVAYPAAGTADATHAQYYFKNASYTVMASLLKAYAYVNSSGTILNSMNVSSVTVNSSGGNTTYSVNFPSGIFPNTNYGVIAIPNTFSGSGYSLVATAFPVTTTQCLCTFRTPQTGTTHVEACAFTVIVLQF